MLRLALTTLLACLIILATPFPARSSPAPFVVAETGRAFPSLAQAVRAVGNSRATIRIAPGLYRQCAVQEEGDVHYQAERPGTVVFDGVACEGKASLVLRGRRARIDGLIFQNVRVPDSNGAGIRLEEGDLVVSESLFREGENGILVANDHEGRIDVVRSTFTGLGACPEDQGCSHSLYNSGGGTLRVARTRFERGTGGHYLKSRGNRIEVVESSFDDSAGQASNYMIDLPAGATGLIRGNVFVQGADKENYSAFIMVGAEEIRHSSAGLRIEDNEASLAPGVDRRTAFVADESGEEIILSGNRLGEGLAAFERR